MQGFARLTLPNGKKVTVLVRETKTSRYLCLSHREVSEGKLGYNRLADEELFLKDNPDHVKRLLDGKTIIL